MNSPRRGESLLKIGDLGLQRLRRERLLEGLLFELSNFHVLFMQSVIEHLKDPVEAVSALARFVKPGGRIILSAPTPENSFWDDPTHVRPYTPKSLLSLGEICGLEVEHLTYVFAFLLGLQLRSPLFYRLLNLFPFPLGSNLLCVYRKAI